MRHVILRAERESRRLFVRELLWTGFLLLVGLVALTVGRHVWRIGWQASERAQMERITSDKVPSLSELDSRPQ